MVHVNTLLLKGEMVQLLADVDSDDSRARYTISLLNRDFAVLGESEEEKNKLLVQMIGAAIKHSGMADPAGNTVPSSRWSIRFHSFVGTGGRSGRCGHVDSPVQVQAASEVADRC